MYGWIWRHLPFGIPGKIVGSLLLVAGVVWLLWFHVFPAVEPILPFDDVTVEGTTGPGGSGSPSGEPSPS